MTAHRLYVFAGVFGVAYSSLFASFSAQGTDVPGAMVKPVLMVVTDPGTGCDWLITMPSGFTTQRLNAAREPVCALRVKKTIADRIAPEMAAKKTLRR